MSSTFVNDKLDAMLGTNNGGIPEDVFYKFIYGKVYTPTSFQGSHYEVSATEQFFGLSRRDAFLGIKQIRPSQEDDCTGNANYIPTNFAFRNRIDREARLLPYFFKLRIENVFGKDKRMGRRVL